MSAKFFDTGKLSLDANPVVSAFFSIFMFAFLAACSAGGFTRGPVVDTTPQAPVEQQPTLGTGSAKIALLLPLTATGNAGKTAEAMKQAAELALFEFNNPDLSLLPIDTQGTAAGAQQAAQQAIQGGAELIIGPLFAKSVSAVAQVARRSNVPVIAFSTDSSVAGNGVYLLSFLPENDVAQIVGYAAQTGKKNLAAILPQNAYGTVVDRALRQSVARAGATLVAVETYPLDRKGMVEPAKRISQIAKNPATKVDAILMPDGPNVIPALAPLLTINGITREQVKFLGSGQWDDARLRSEPSVRGGWYPAPNPNGWRSFSQRFQKNYSKQPPRIASLAYDATSLAAALARQPAGQRFSQRTLTNPSGFSGIDGIFRFRNDGLNERGLAILEITGEGGSKIIRNAPRSFSAVNF